MWFYSLPWRYLYCSPFPAEANKCFSNTLYLFSLLSLLLALDDNVKLIEFIFMYHVLFLNIFMYIIWTTTPQNGKELQKYLVYGVWEK